MVVHRLTIKERQFAKHFAATGDATYSAAKAGYAAPQQSGSNNANNEAVIAESRRINARLLATNVLQLAVTRHEALLRDPLTSGPTLVRAIDLAYKYGLKPAEGEQAKEPHEMTAEELARARDRLLGELAARSKPVLDLAPAGDKPEPDVFD